MTSARGKATTSPQNVAKPLRHGTKCHGGTDPRKGTAHRVTLIEVHPNQVRAHEGITRI